MGKQATYMAWVNRQRTWHGWINMQDVWSGQTGKIYCMDDQLKNDAHNYQLIHKLVVKLE